MTENRATTRSARGSAYVGPFWYYGTWVLGAVLALLANAYWYSVGVAGYIFVPVFVAVSIFFRRKSRARAVASHRRRLELQSRADGLKADESVPPV